MPAGNLHGYAVQAEANLEKLATGLAQAGADEGTVKTISQMADVTRKIVKALGKGQEATGDQEPPAPEEAPEGEGAPEPEQPASIGSATDEMMAAKQPPAQGAY